MASLRRRGYGALPPNLKEKITKEEYYNIFKSKKPLYVTAQTIDDINYFCIQNNITREKFLDLIFTEDVFDYIKEKI